MQTDTRQISLERFMRSAAFRRGLAEVRAGQAPNFDCDCDAFSYEAGRQFGCVVPRNMQITVNGRLNPRAAELFDRGVGERFR